MNSKDIEDIDCTREYVQLIQDSLSLYSMKFQLSFL